MSDTHDKRDGDEAAVQPWWEMPLGEERQVAKYHACWPDFDCDHDHDEGERILRERELTDLRGQLAAAIARAESATVLPERWRALIAERDAANERAEKAEAERREDVAAARRERDEAKAEVANLNACLMLFLARYGNQTFHDGDLKRAAEWLTALAPDAAPDGRSATETDSEPFKAFGVELEFEKVSAGLSEPELPRDTSAWCWAPNPNGPLHCGRLRDHEPPHQRGERTWTDDDTTEGRP